MQKKLIGILICFMLLSTLLTVAKPAEKTQQAVLLLNENVPEWHIGNQWRYKLDDITFGIYEEEKTIDLVITIDDLLLEVNDIIAPYYMLVFETYARGKCIVDVNLGDGPIKMNITFSDLKISGNITIEETNLGIKEINALLQGRFSIEVIEQPYISLPFSPSAIPFPITMNVSLNFDTPFSIMNFPLSVPSVWNSTSTNVTINGKIKSIWFNIIHIINVIAGIFQRPILPPEIAALLPVIDIKNALMTFGSGNVFEIPLVESAFFCTNTEMITIPAGTYEAYNITIVGGIGQLLYAPTSGTVVTITAADFEEIIPYLKKIKLELQETNYR